MGDTYDGYYMGKILRRENQTFPLPSFSINDILEYVEDYCFIDGLRLRNPQARGATHYMKGGDIWAGFGRKPNNKLRGWYITFNAKMIRIKMSEYTPNTGSLKFVWDNYTNPPYIGYYDGETYYSKPMECVKRTTLMSSQMMPDFDVKMDSDDFIQMSDEGLKEKYFKIPYRVFGTWASMNFVSDMAHFRIDTDLINPRHLGLINWPYEKPQGLI
tara:strand:- start:13692 stop:14336 length:645 start_codon:yes stop_codon:yes gene_type:complete